MDRAIRIKLSGIGGQGIQLLGKLFGQAAYNAGFSVSQAVIYEPVTSGGLTTMDISIFESGKTVEYPYIDEEPDILLILAQKAWKEFSGILGSNTHLIIDPDQVEVDESTKIAKKMYSVPFTRLAETEVGSKKMANAIALGFIAEFFDIAGNHLEELLVNTKPEDAEEPVLLEIDPAAFESTLLRFSPDRFKEMNLQAFKIGYALSLEQGVSL